MGKEEKKLDLFKYILDYILLKKKDKKIFLFVPEKFYNGINNFLRKTDKYRITGEPIIYFTPVFNMKKCMIIFTLKGLLRVFVENCMTII